MKFDDSDFGAYQKKNDSSGNNTNDINSDSSNGVYDKPDMAENKASESTNDSHLNSDVTKESDSDFGSYARDVDSSDLSGAKADNSKKISEMSSSEKVNAAASDAVDYAKGDYVSIANRHKSDIKDKATKAAAANTAAKAATTTAKAAAISKGIGALKSLFQIAGAFIKGVATKIAGWAVAAGQAVAAFFSVSVVVGTAIVAASAVGVGALSIALIVNLTMMNNIARYDAGPCNPEALVDMYEDSGISAQALRVAEQAEEWATPNGKHVYVCSGEAWAIKEKGKAPIYGTGPGTECDHFVQLCFWKCGSNVFKEGDKSHGNVPKMREFIEAYEYEPASIEEIKVGTVCVYGSDKHTGIYIGNGKVAHASSSATGIKISSESSEEAYFGKTRYFYPYEAGGVATVQMSKSAKRKAESTKTVPYEKNTSSNTDTKSVKMRVWKALGYCGCTNESAAAVMGNIEQESGFHYKSDSGAAKGLFQMESGRQTACREFCKMKTGDEWNVEAQVEFAMNVELDEQVYRYSGGHKWYDYKSKGTVRHEPSHESWAWWGKEKYDETKFVKGTNIDELTEVFCRTFERPSVPAMDNRIKAAHKYYKYKDILDLASMNGYMSSLNEDDGCGEPMLKQAHTGALGAVEWAKQIADDNSFAYGTGDTAHRGGCYFCGTNWGPHKYKKAKGYEKTYCCNPFVFSAYAHGSGDEVCLKICQRGSNAKTGMSPSSWVKCGFEVVWNGGPGKPKVSDLKPGDVMMKSSHVWMVSDPSKEEIVEASGGDWSSSSISYHHSNNCRLGEASAIVRYVGGGKGI